MALPLPSRPSVEQLKKQAKELLRAWQAQDAAALERLKASHPEYASKPLADSNALALADAQLVLAREYGHSSWPKLRHAIENLNGQSQDEVDAFMSAVRAGDHPQVRAKLEANRALACAFDRHAFDANPVTLAASRGDLKLVDLLLEFGADINKPSRWWAGGFTPLHGVFWNDRKQELADALIARGAVLDLHSAAGLGKLEAVRAWLAKDPALVNARAGDGMAPLHYAATPAIAAFLLDQGAEIDLRDLDHGGTPAQHAVKDRQDVTRFLIQRGAKPDLFMAAALNDPALAEKLYAADPGCLQARVGVGEFKLKDSDGGHIYCYVAGGETPFQAAAVSNAGAMVDWLVRHGANVNERAGYDDGTALHFCAWNDSLEGARKLLDLGAELECRSGKIHENTPMGWAIVSGSARVVKLFIERGAKLLDYYFDEARKGKAGEFRQFKHVPLERYTEIEAALLAAKQSRG